MCRRPHVAVNTQALRHGKHVYCEKPLALSVEDAPMLALARERNLRVGCAPDTFLGGGANLPQTGGRRLDRRPISGTAVMMADTSIGIRLFITSKAAAPCLTWDPIT